MKSRTFHPALMAALLMGVAVTASIPEPPARSTQRDPKIDTEYKSAAQKKRERKNANRSRNGAKS